MDGVSHRDGVEPQGGLAGSSSRVLGRLDPVVAAGYRLSRSRIFLVSRSSM
jgi:hypothetical protein